MAAAPIYAQYAPVLYSPPRSRTTTQQTSRLTVSTRTHTLSTFTSKSPFLFSLVSKKYLLPPPPPRKQCSCLANRPTTNKLSDKGEERREGWMDTAFILARKYDVVASVTRRGRDASRPFRWKGAHQTRVTGLKLFSNVLLERFKHSSKTRISKFPRFLSSAPSSRSPAPITVWHRDSSLSLSLSVYPRFEEGEAV